MGQLIQSEPSSSGAQGEEEARKEALRKAGAEYFNQVLEQARKGQNVTNDAPRRSRQPARDVEAQDEDLEAVGQAIPYAVGLLYFAACSARLVLLQLSLDALGTPGIQVFLHLLPAVCLTYALVDLRPLSAASLRACSVAIVLFALQTLALFGALADASLPLVLGWTTLAPPLLARLIPGRSATAPRPGALHTLLLALGCLGAAGAVASGPLPPPLSLLCLAGWTAAEAAKALWQRVKADPQALPPQLGARAAELLGPIAAEEARVPAATRAFLGSAATAVPALLLGFVCQEGGELVDHELSVPEVSNILLSCGAWTAAAAAGAALFRSVAERTQARLTAFTALAALGVQAAMVGVGQPAAFGAALLAVAGGVGAAQYEA